MLVVAQKAMPTTTASSARMSAKLPASLVAIERFRSVFME